MLELALLTPWVFFLFVGALDWGFFAYGLITTENAVRTAAEYTSRSSGSLNDSAGACTVALGVMRKLPNVGNNLTTCNSDPVTVTVTAANGPDGAPSTLVSVSYRTVSLIPIPGLLPGQVKMTRTLRMRG